MMFHEETQYKHLMALLHGSIDKGTVMRPKIIEG